MRAPCPLLVAVITSLTVGCASSDKCDHPAPLTGQRQPDQDRFGYLVKLHDGVDAQAESTRLGNSYAFTPRLVITAGASPADADGFIAKIDDDVRDRLRCEPSVASVSYDSIVP